MTAAYIEALGVEKLVRDERTRIEGKRIGLLAHPASVDRRWVHTLHNLREAGASVEMIFGPEHGFGGAAQDMEPVVGRALHPSGIPVVSLYGACEETLAPAPADLNGLDALVVDLQDVGARYYTFVWTALLALRACRRVGVELIVTDRPNPLGGAAVEGAPQTPECCSFVGLKPVSVRHGMTVGEILMMAASDEGLSDALTVVPMDGWRRDRWADEIGAPWVMPSPNMPTLDTATVYPGMCLVEGTTLSEGRGTTRPFELIGAPNLDGDAFAAKLNAFQLPGAGFRPVVFKPKFQKHAGVACGGVQIHVTDRRRFLPYRTGTAVILAARDLLGERFAWRRDSYEFVSDVPAIELLSGSDALRTMTDDGACLDDITAVWQAGEAAFREQRTAHLLY